MFEIFHCHNCSVDAQANITALFLIVCAHGYKLWFYQIKLIIRLASDSLLFLGKPSCRASSGAVSVVAVPTHVLYTGLYSCLVSSPGADPLTYDVSL